MNMSTSQLEQQTITAIQSLIQYNLDSVKGFKQAAEQIDHPQLENWLISRAGERKVYAEELQSFVEMTDDQPEDSGTTAGSFHRWWMSLRESLSSDDTEAVLKEAVRGENKIKSEYESSIKQTTGNPINDVLHRQYNEIVSNYNEVKSLSDEYDD